MTTPKAFAIYHVIRPADDFDQAAHALLECVQKAQEIAPGAPRALYLDIEGHRNAEGGFDHDMYELQRNYVLEFLGPFLTSVHMPLGNFEPEGVQFDDVPEALEIRD